MINKKFNIFKISLFFFFISSYSFSNEITLKVNQVQNDFQFCRFFVDAFNNTNMNITEMWLDVTYFDKDDYIIDRKDWWWRGLKPNKNRLIERSQSFVNTNEENMPCNQVGRVEINNIWGVQIDGDYPSDKDFYENLLYEIIKIINNLPNIQVVKN